MSDIKIYAVSPKSTHIYVASQEVLYGGISSMLRHILSADNRMVALLKVALKGFLLINGAKILDDIYKSKEHPMPGKKDDLVMWYLDVFASVVVRDMASQELVFSGQETQHHEHGNEPYHVFTVTELHTRSAPKDAD